MALKQIAGSLLSCLAAVWLAGCAATGDTAEAPAATTAAAACRRADASTGTSIRRRDCSINPDVQTVRADELEEYKRSNLPSSSGIK